jgi:hypothetical protein
MSLLACIGLFAAVVATWILTAAASAGAVVLLRHRARDA